MQIQVQFEKGALIVFHEACDSTSIAQQNVLDPTCPRVFSAEPYDLWRMAEGETELPEIVIL